MRKRSRAPNLRLLRASRARRAPRAARTRVKRFFCIFGIVTCWTNLFWLCKKTDTGCSVVFEINLVYCCSLSLLIITDKTSKSNFWVILWIEMENVIFLLLFYFHKKLKYRLNRWIKKRKFCFILIHLSKKCEIYIKNQTAPSGRLKSPPIR